MIETPNSSQNISNTALSTKPKSSALKWMLPLMGVLLVLAGLVWSLQPKEPVVEASPVQKVKTVAEVQKQMDAIKTNTNIPDGEKGRILGFMKMEMDRAKALERGEAPAPMSQNPPGPK
jgi:hypothetical protein